MFTLKFYSADNVKTRVFDADSLTILRDGGDAEIILHQRIGEDFRIDVSGNNKRPAGWPPVFQRVIIESGFGRMTNRPLVAAIPAELPSAEQTGQAFAESVGVSGRGKDALDKLRALPALTIRADLNFTGSRKLYSGPILDGRIIPEAGETAPRDSALAIGPTP